MYPKITILNKAKLYWVITYRICISCIPWCIYVQHSYIICSRIVKTVLKTHDSLVRIWVTIPGVYRSEYKMNNVTIVFIPLDGLNFVFRYWFASVLATNVPLFTKPVTCWKWVVFRWFRINSLRPINFYKLSRIAWVSLIYRLIAI